jgi:hypothetical protein
MEVSCPKAIWPCACPNIAPAQSRQAKILLAALQLLIDRNADTDDLPILVSIVIAAEPQVNEHRRSQHRVDRLVTLLPRASRTSSPFPAPNAERTEQHRR